MEQNFLIQLCERLASLETKVNILMFFQSAITVGVVTIGINKIFRNGKNGNGNGAK